MHHLVHTRHESTLTLHTTSYITSPYIHLKHYMHHLVHTRHNIHHKTHKYIPNLT